MSPEKIASGVVQVRENQPMAWTQEVVMGREGRDRWGTCPGSGDDSADGLVARAEGEASGTPGLQCRG